ncbi:MAG: hypothetical protein H6937_09290 [Burkholderiales bacterium]|nr:hypothetical protein [Burkholderiales bacterium]MDR4517511.1 hypothetical protein [Nitrosomonas sp.]
MKTVQTLTITSILAFILVSLPVSIFAADQVNHLTLAQQYKQQAEEYQAKIEEEIEAVRNKPRTAFFGRNAKTFKQHVEFKLRNFEMAMTENLEKAAYHEKMAAEQNFQPVSVSSSNSDNIEG